MRHVSGHRRRQGRRAPRGAGNRFLGRPLSFETDPTEKRQTSLADRPSGRRRSLQQRPRKLPRVVTRDRSRASPPSSAAVGGGVLACAAECPGDRQQSCPERRRRVPATAVGSVTNKRTAVIHIKQDLATSILARCNFHPFPNRQGIA